MTATEKPPIRVAIGEFSQETNSFTGIPTTLAEFTGRGGDRRHGPAIIAAHKGANTVLGGFIEALEAYGHAIVPTLAARACPGGPLTAECYRTLRDDLLERLADADADAILLSLHGAMVAESEPDPEADILKRVREIAGKRPVVVVLDMHANLSSSAAASADVIVGYRTYPHVDMGESGARAATALQSISATGAKVHTAYRRLPLLLPSINMRTDDGTGPMARVQQLVESGVAGDSDLLEAAVFGGFPYADVPCSHASVVTFSTRDPSHASVVADDLAQRLWAARSDFNMTTEPAEAAVEEAMDSSERPFVLADIADNPGSGGTGETTTLLRLLLEHNEDAFVGVLHDPESVDQAFQLQSGTSALFRIGGKIEPKFGRPVEVRATIERLSDGEFTYEGPMLRGKKDRLGRSALLRVGNVLIGITEGRASVNDPNMLRMLGVEPSAPRILALKVKGHFRAAFGPIVARIVNAEAPGASMTDFTKLPYEHLTHPIYPFDEVTDWRQT